ncbi:hypothetical protein HHK36_011454 [Tetracentron sinense]|uniref:HVA22-like protein n=1 Tax=Tetracentron sinense TaxID=13715 RepID=A0A835DJW5_TETSI|nr:hypothetical protein HHK36_011454 [Tetracentron sinense]
MRLGCCRAYPSSPAIDIEEVCRDSALLNLMIVVAVLTVFERFGDVFVSWLPMYGEMKLAFVIYLWHPKTKGASYVYQTFLRPYIAEHETDIDRKFLELRARVWDLVIQHWQNSADFGQNAFLQIIQYLVAQFSKARNNNTTQVNLFHSLLFYLLYPPSAPPLPNATASFHRHSQTASGKWPPAPPPPPPPTTINGTVSPIPKSDHLPCETHSQATVGEAIAVQEFHMDDMLQAARIRLRRSRQQQ